MPVPALGVLNKTERYSYIAFPVDRPGRTVQITLSLGGNPAWATIVSDRYNKILSDARSNTLVARLVYIGAFREAEDTLRILQAGLAPVQSDVYIDNTSANIPELEVFIYS